LPAKVKQKDVDDEPIDLKALPGSQSIRLRYKPVQCRRGSGAAEQRPFNNMNLLVDPIDKPSLSHRRAKRRRSGEREPFRKCCKM